ncbi:MAG: DUF4231 domain-containing protein [Gaiellaceae bacterium]
MAIAEPTRKPPAAVPPEAGEGNPTLQRLEDQIAWYDRSSARCQQRFKWLKAVVIAAAAAIPVVAAFDVPVYVAGILGAVVVVTEGLVQVNQYHQNWITYRSTAEALKHEKYLFLARADVYSGSSKPLQLLAERIEGLISQEHARWVSSRRHHTDAEEDEEEPQPER